MTNAIKRTPSETGTYTYVIAINPVDYPTAEWAHDPDISAVADEPRLYWKWDEATTTVIPMTQAEKDIVDDIGFEILTDQGDSLKIDITDNFPKSKLAGNPIAVHASYKPEIEGSTTYAVWSGAGDDMNDPTNGNGNGPLLSIQTEIGKPTTYVDVEFNPIYGRVWLHEAYIKFTNGGNGDSISSVIMSYPVPLQQAVQLDLIVENNWIKYSTGGPSTGTHGFADPTKITLVDRTFSADGDWDYGADGLVPNFAGTGQYKMSDIEQTVHRYVNKVPCFGNCATYFSMSSDETTELLTGYFARIILNNESNTSWHASILMEIYREQTYNI